MFVERLLAALSAPHGRLGELDDMLVVDVDRYRALLMREARALTESGQIDRTVASWAFTCIADGWVDDHLHSVRDSLIELGAVGDQAHLDRLLHAAVLQILGAGTSIAAADGLLLETVTQQGAAGAPEEPLGLRILARRYALEVGLLFRGDGQLGRTGLGDTALRLPRHNLLSYLLALEMLQSGGGGDRWRTPRRALSHMLEQRGFEVPTTAQARRVLDPEGLLPWRRVRRLTLMGVCEPVGEIAACPEDTFACRHRLLPHGEEALRQVLREPPCEMVRLAEVLLQEQTRQALRPLLSRGRTEGAPRREAERPVPADARSMRPAVAVPLGQRARPAAGREAEALRRSANPAASSGAAAEPAAPVVASALGSPMGPPMGPPMGIEPLVGPEAAALEVGVFSVAGAAQGLAQAADGAALHGALALEDLAPAPDLDLSGLVRRAWEELRVQRVQFDVGGPLVSLQGDRRALLQVFRELLRAAAEAALLGPAPARVSVEVQPGDDEVTALVRDSGPPLSAADREGLLDPSLGMLGEGGRTGLWRAHRMVVGQGGTLVLAPPQKGETVVRLVLPRAHRQARRAVAA